MSESECYWMVGCSTADQPRESIYMIMRSRIFKHNLACDATVFNVPSTLKIGSFDNLIQIADDLSKHDATCEQLLRRIEKETLDMDPNTEFRIMYQRNTMTVEQYLYRFSWDDARYPKNQQLADLIKCILNFTVKTDNELRIKLAAYHEIKKSNLHATKTNSLSFLHMNLVEVLTPDITCESDFVESQHLTTLIAIVSPEKISLWKSSYESLAEGVVPTSTKQFIPVDKEGNTLWRIVVFKKSADLLIEAAKEKKIIVRKFQFVPEELEQIKAERARLANEQDKQEVYMSRMYQASFSEVCKTWIHIKAMRIFVESVLRFGIPVNFASFLIKPNVNKEKRLRAELDLVFTTKDSFGDIYTEKNQNFKIVDDSSHEKDVGDGEYYRYVSLQFRPFLIHGKK